MRRAHPFFVIIVLTAIACFAAAPVFAQAGRVGGVVKDEADQPIKGATVRAENPAASPSTFTTTTDAKGRFSIIGLKGGEWTFTAEAPGYAPSQGKLRVQTISQNPPVTFRLAKGATGPGGGALAGVNMKELQAELQAADTLYNAGQYDEAIAAYQAIMTKAPSLTVINLQIGTAYRQKKEYDKALTAFAEALKSDPANEKARVAIGMTHLEIGATAKDEAARQQAFAEADKILTEAAVSPGATREVLYSLGEVKFAKSEMEQAAQWYQKASELDPSWGKPLFKLGLVALNKGDKAGAASYFEKVVAADPNSAEAAQAKAVIDQLKK